LIKPINSCPNSAVDGIPKISNMRSHPKTEGADAITRPRSPITI